MRSDAIEDNLFDSEIYPVCLYITKMLPELNGISASTI